MKYFWIILSAVVVFVGVSVLSTYNKLVNLEETANQAWSDVQTQYQRRADLIPNIVNTVKGYADFEKSTLVEVITARASALAPQINLSDLTPEKLAAFQAVQDGVSSALSKLLVVVEKYPELKANQNFLALQEQLEGTENRIAYVREQFNTTIMSYNKKLRTFPMVFWNNLFLHFEKRNYFESSAGSENAPALNF